MKTITGQVNAYLHEYSSVTPEDFLAPEESLVGRLIYSNFETPKGWTKVGTATITVDLVHPDNVIANKVEALRAELQSHRAESHAIAKRFEDQISKLLAISYDKATA